MGNWFSKSESKCTPDVRTPLEVKDHLNSEIGTSIQITNFIRGLISTVLSYLKSVSTNQVLKCVGCLASLQVKLVILGTQLVFSIYSRYNATTLSLAFRHLEDLKSELNNANEIFDSIGEKVVDKRLRNKWKYFHKNSIDSIDAFIRKYYKRFFNFGWGDDYTQTFKTIEKELNQIIEFGEKRSQDLREFFSQLGDVKKKIAECPEISCYGWKRILWEACLDMLLNTLVWEAFIEAFMLPLVQTGIDKLIKQYLEASGATEGAIPSKEFLEWLAMINNSNPEFVVGSLFILPNLLVLLPKALIS